VDDNATNREIVSRQARSWGMEPVAVELPSEALALIEQGEHFDVAALDMVMPEMNGLELARQIRRLRDERELPLVLLTSLAGLPQARSAEEFSAQLAKPVKASQLYNALVSVLTEPVKEGAPIEAAAGDGRPETSSLRILLAEDNAVNQKVALRILDKLGYRADVASNGLEAIEALDVIVSREEAAIALPLVRGDLTPDEDAAPARGRDKWIEDLAADPQRVWRSSWLALCARHAAER
jgi:CheY-like chemotaxis protein